MKKIIALMLAVMMCFMLTACKDNTDSSGENKTDINEITSDALNNNEDTSSGSVSLENYTAAYVEPKFKMVSKLEDCYDYFETDATDTVETEKNEDGTVSSITVKDKAGKVKADMKFSYTKNRVVSVTFYGADGKDKKVSFSFYDNNSINIAAYADGESNMSFYFYNKDGTFNSYMDGSGLSSMISGAVMEGIGNAFS